MLDRLSDRLQKKLQLLRKLQSELKSRKPPGRHDYLSLRKQYALVRHFLRLSRKVKNLKYHMALTSFGGAALLMASPNDASAQNIGPFIELTRAENPLRSSVHKGYATRSVLVDLDNDGDLDVVFGRYVYGESPLLQYIQNVGTPTKPVFEYINTDSPSYPFQGINGFVGSYYYNTAPQFADIDLDNDLDLFISGNYGDIRYFRNDGGSFHAAGVPNEGVGPWDPVAKTGNPLHGIQNLSDFLNLAFVDLDGDQDMDVMVGHNYSYLGDGQNMHYFINNTDLGASPALYGGFTPDPPENTSDGIFPFGTISPAANSDGGSPVFVDVDEDNDLDLLIGNGSVYFYANDGSNNFTQQYGQWIPGNGVTPGQGNPFNSFSAESGTNLSFGDLDGDGDLDAIVSTYDYSPIQYFRNDGNGVFTQLNDLQNPFGGIDDAESLSLYTDPVTKKVGIVVDPYDGPYRLYLPNEEGEFVWDPTSPFNEINEDPYSITALGDIIGEADPGESWPEILVGRISGNLHLYQNDGTGHFTYVSETDLFDNVTTEDGSIPVFVDIDSDGDLDLFIGDKYGNIKVYINTGTKSDPEFTPDPEFFGPDHIPSINSSYPDFDRSDIAFQDLDGDGDLDLFVTGKYGFFSEAEVNYFENTGTPQAPIFNTLPAPSPFAGLEVGQDVLLTFIDIDNDGDLDAFGTEQYSVIHFYQNQNPAPFGTALAQVPLLSGEPVLFDPNYVLTDTDDDPIVSLTMTIAGFLPGEETLVATNVPSGIAVTFSDGVLSMVGYNPAADFQAAVRSVEYTYTGQGGQRIGKGAARTIDRAITINVRDAEGTLDPTLQTVTHIVHSNDLPTISPSVANAAYENSALNIHPTITVADGDDAQLQSATISIVNGFVSTEDNLSYTAVAGITGSFNSTTGILVLTGPATKADFQMVLRSVVYTNLSSTPSPAARSIHFVINDGESNSNTSVVSLSFLGGLAPALTANNVTRAFTSSTIVLNPGISITDADSPELVSATIMFNAGLVPSEDRLLFTNSGSITGSYDATAGILTLSGTASLADYVVALNSISYENTNASPNRQDRILSFIVSDGSNVSNTQTFAITFPNVAPVISPASSVAFYSGSNVQINPTLVISDADNTVLQSALISVTAGYQPAEDILSFTNQNGITGAFNSSTGILSLTGSSSVANYQTALRSVTYHNLLSSPSTANRTVSFSVNDGTATSALATTTIVINKPPVISAESLVTQAGGNVVLFIDEILSDPDDNLDLSTLIVTSKAGAIVSVDSGIITINYSNVPNYRGVDELTITVCDLGGECNTQIISIGVSAEAYVFNGLSPNGDNTNDYFKIQYLLPGSSVTIHNRWGDAVFEMNDYDNDVSSKRFEGLNNNGGRLPSAIYFYQIKMTDGRVTTGFLTLKW